MSDLINEFNWRIMNQKFKRFPDDQRSQDIYRREMNARFILLRREGLL